jgi:ribonuclease Y
MVLEKMALRLGRQAVSKLHINGLNEEIIKMVGALNWRTSYRQNQYYHSLEVAELAGILATELHEDVDTAKRCGLLHDIGKGLDYKIEGSHAIISGDYADRYGESKLICDTIMSHHNDIVLETPLSYLLKTADTLSGARPGARVHLEEGYQIRLAAIDQSIRSFSGILKVAIMSGGREVHVEVNHKKVKENELEKLTKEIVHKIETDVAFPGQIKVVVTRRFEAIAVA